MKSEYSDIDSADEEVLYLWRYCCGDSAEVIWKALAVDRPLTSVSPQVRSGKWSSAMRMTAAAALVVGLVLGLFANFYPRDKPAAAYQEMLQALESDNTEQRLVALNKLDSFTERPTERVISELRSVLIRADDPNVQFAILAFLSGMDEIHAVHELSGIETLPAARTRFLVQSLQFLDSQHSRRGIL